MKKNVVDKIIVVSICFVLGISFGMSLVGCSDSDDDSPISWWLDSDGDGYGDSTNETEAFQQPEGYVSNAQDCDDSNADINPEATDTCGDGIDQNCDGSDGSAEICGDGIDQDCDGSDLECPPEDIDDDGDGYTENQGDCNDNDNTVHPEATETCGDGIDQDCNGSDLECGPEDTDDDGDGYTENEGDCNDADDTIHPNASETCGDGIDQDCNGSDLECGPQVKCCECLCSRCSFRSVTTSTGPISDSCTSICRQGCSQNPNCGSYLFGSPCDD